MTADRSVGGDRPQAPAESGNGLVAELDELRRGAVELLAALDRPPRTLRIRAGLVTVDLSWPDGDGVRPAAAAPEEPPPADAPPPVCLTSPMVGVFYRSPQPGADPFVSVGTVVRPGQQVGIVEAMKLMVPVEADWAGRVSAVLKGDGEPVEYGEPLFAFEDTDAAG